MKWTLLICIALLAACGKKPDAPTASETPTTSPAPAAASASAPSDASATAQENWTKTLDRLTQAVRKFSAENRRVPKDLSELVAAGYLPEMPAAPPGKRYIIDDQLRVQLK